MSLRVHFLNVGRGDCTIIEFPSGRVGMVDISTSDQLDENTLSELRQEYYRDALIAIGQGGHVTEEEVWRRYAGFTDPLDYYDRVIGRDRPIFRLIITHPDMDHMTGLYRLYEVEQRPVLNFWHTGFYNFDMDNADWEDCPYDERDWRTFKKLRQGGLGNPRSLLNYCGAAADFWAQDGVEIWAPTPDLERLAIAKGEKNILSMVLKLTYRGRSIVLGGDATSDETWPAILHAGGIGKVDVLKASHHGRKTGYHGESVKVMAPVLTITSVGEVEHDATSNYRRYSDYTVSLRKAGDVVIEIGDDGQIYCPGLTTLQATWKPRTS